MTAGRMLQTAHVALSALLVCIPTYLVLFSMLFFVEAAKDPSNVLTRTYSSFFAIISGIGAMVVVGLIVLGLRLAHGAVTRGRMAVLAVLDVGWLAAVGYLVATSQYAGLFECAYAICVGLSGAVALYAAVGAVVRSRRPPAQVDDSPVG